MLFAHSGSRIHNKALNPECKNIPCSTLVCEYSKYSGGITATCLSNVPDLFPVHALVSQWTIVETMGLTNSH